MSEEKKFRFQNQRVELTYRTHLDKHDYIEWIEKQTKITPKFIRLAHELGDTTCDYEHTHVVIDFGKAFDSKNCRIFDYNGIHPHIEPLVKKLHWNNAVKYLSKEDKENEDLKDFGIPPVLVVWNSRTVTEALANCENLAHVNGIIAAMKYKKREITPKPLELRPWQDEIMLMCNEFVNRKVIWIYDQKGGCGKSTFCRYLITNFPEKYTYMDQMGGQRDGASILKVLADKGWCGDTILIDLPRAAIDREIYAPLESMKNGMFTTTKYEGETYMMNECHVVIMANFPPDVHKLSHDRWDIRKIMKTHMGDALTEPLNIKEAQLERQKYEKGEFDSPYRKRTLEEMYFGTHG